MVCIQEFFKKATKTAIFGPQKCIFRDFQSQNYEFQVKIVRLQARIGEIMIDTSSITMWTLGDPLITHWACRKSQKMQKSL